MRSGRPTIRDVAAAAGVSTATVSYVLNETPGQTITPVTRERVRRAAGSIGYVPHRVARALREGRSRVVLLHLASTAAGNSGTSFIAGMSEELRQHDHTLLVTADRHGSSPEIVDAVAPRAVLDLARVAVSSDADAAAVTGGDHLGLSYHSTTQLGHLADRGHRAVALAVSAGPRDALVGARLEHMARAAADLGMAASVIVEIDMGHEPGLRVDAVRRLVEEHDVTAVAAHDDDVALGVLAAMSTLGYRAPGDLAVIGFDEGNYGHLWQPALTTVRINADAYGRRAARVLLGLEPAEWTEPPSEVVVRETT